MFNAEIPDRVVQATGIGGVLLRVQGVGDLEFMNETTVDQRTLHADLRCNRLKHRSLKSRSGYLSESLLFAYFANWLIILSKFEWNPEELEPIAPGNLTAGNALYSLWNFKTTAGGATR